MSKPQTYILAALNRGLASGGLEILTFNICLEALISE